MSKWTKDQKLDAVIEVIQEHTYVNWWDGPGCACHFKGEYWPHLRQMIDNEGLITADGEY